MKTASEVVFKVRGRSRRYRASPPAAPNGRGWPAGWQPVRMGDADDRYRATNPRGRRTARVGRETTLADGMSLRDAPIAKVQVGLAFGDAARRHAVLLSGAQSHTAAGYRLRRNTYVRQPSRVVRYLPHDDWIFHS
jgi:hypothetical protein